MIDELDWDCSIERMICYFIEANRCITDKKDKYIENYITEIIIQINTKDYNSIIDRVNIMNIDKYIPNKWDKIKGKYVKDYGAIVFYNLSKEFGEITEEKIIKETAKVLEKYTTEAVISSKCLKIYASICK